MSPGTCLVSPAVASYQGYSGLSRGLRLLRSLEPILASRTRGTAPPPPRAWQLPGAVSSPAGPAAHHGARVPGGFPRAPPQNPPPPRGVSRGVCALPKLLVFSSVAALVCPHPVLATRQASGHLPGGAGSRSRWRLMITRALQLRQGLIGLVSSDQTRSRRRATAPRAPPSYRRWAKAVAPAFHPQWRARPRWPGRCWVPSWRW